VKASHVVIVLLIKTGPRCISFRCKITVSLAQGAVHDAEADVADPVFVRSTVTRSHWVVLLDQLVKMPLDLACRLQCRCQCLSCAVVTKPSAHRSAVLPDFLVSQLAQRRVLHRMLMGVSYTRSLQLDSSMVARGMTWNSPYISQAYNTR